MRLIDADELEYIRVRIFHGLNEDGTPCVGGWNAVLMSCAIKDAPTVDAVPVVRCKDCIHYTPVEGGPPLCTQHNIAVFNSGFCSYGERSASNV